METLDLRDRQCPMALVLLKRFLLLQSDIVEAKKVAQLKVLFSNQQAMQDIILYLDRAGYNYSENQQETGFSLMIQLEGRKTYV